MNWNCRLYPQFAVAIMWLAGFAANAQAEITKSPVVIPQASQFDLTAKSGLDYRIFLAIPQGQPPEQGWPVIYVTDGNLNFLPFVAAAQKQSRGGLATVVVGIGYPSADRQVHFARRSLDLAPETSPEWKEKFAKGMAVSKTGGQDPFLTFIDEELKPVIEAEAPIDKNRQAIFGHSLGGLLVLHALFQRPESFQYYFPASPSIWWNDRSILREAEAFLSQKPAKPVAAHLLVSVGELEEQPDPTEPPERDRVNLERKMVTSAQDICERLKSVGRQGLDVQCRVFAGDHHGSVVISAANASLRMLLTEPAKDQTSSKNAAKQVSSLWPTKGSMPADQRFRQVYLLEGP